MTYNTILLAKADGLATITLNAPAFESPQDGIAVIGATQTANGVWQFKAPAALIWTPFPAVSSTSALFVSVR